MVSPAVLGQTIAVVDKSGKVVSTSKNLLNVFREAKYAYRERKAEIHAHRQVELEGKRIRRSSRALDYDDRGSVASSRPRSQYGDVPRRKPVPERRRSGTSEISATSSRRNEYRYEQDLRMRSPKSPRPHQELARRHTTQENQHDELMLAQPPRRTRSSSAIDIDMDLAYGDLPPNHMMVSQPEEEAELKNLVGKVKRMLEEADCVKYSVTATIAHLQKNPEAMAAVALTLAEISNLVSKMAPGMLMSLKGAAPAVFALLASPQFLIAAGVGVGVTIVALGGYKIIKKIKAKKAAEEPGMDEMLEIGVDINRIDNWRRGIAEVEEQSIGTSVDGEFITPAAANLSRLNLQDERTRESRPEAQNISSVKTSKTVKTSKSSRTSKSAKTDKSEKEKKEKKEKKPSPLRLMFK